MEDWFPENAQAEIARQAALASVEVFDELSSTSDYLLEHSSGYANRTPALVVARRQTKGRGRAARQWFAGDGALTFSLLFRPQDMPIGIENWPRSSIVAGVAMCQAIEPLVEPDLVQVKWPNDVYLAGRKVCGILVEKRGQGQPFLCVGIGVNVNNSLEAAPPDVQQRAIALTDVTHQKHFLPEILLGFLERFQMLCQQNAQSLAALLPYWQTHCLLSGRQVETQQGGEQVIGECRGIDATGALLVDTAVGQRAIFSGEIVRW